MNHSTHPKFTIVGISIRTTNENGQSGLDLPALWNTFFTKGILEKIPDKTDNSIYCVYTDYEKDHTKPYTALLGCRVKKTETLPEGMTSKTFDEGVYEVRKVKGNLMDGVVFQEWTKTWNSDLKRSFIADFEIYHERSEDPANAEVDIFVGITE